MFRTRRQRRAIVGLIAAAGALVPAAGLTQEQAGAARPSDVVVSTAWLADRLDDPSVVVIATGTRESYDAGHVPGARFVGHDDLLGGDHRLAAPALLAARLARAGATDTARVVLYGDRPMETGWLYMALASIGHGDHVSLLDGNVRAWREDGHQANGRPAGCPAPRPCAGRISSRTWRRTASSRGKPSARSWKAPASCPR
ncbi:MAG TPA: rhodanese-like domain-containing protein, partial [Vicinamibacterales bacterium]|nr:rhodanese-like domain-containing protein [Vicinamibacterales bacterium]